MSRSFHFVPGHRVSFLEKIPKLEADRIVLELEDGVGAVSYTHLTLPTTPYV